MHEELVKQKSGFQSRIQTRDEEISRLRSQVNSLFTKSTSFLGRLLDRSHGKGRCVALQIVAKLLRIVVAHLTSLNGVRF